MINTQEAAARAFDPYFRLHGPAKPRSWKNKRLGRVAVEAGIRSDPNGFNVRVTHRGRCIERRFGREYSIESLRAWREETRRRMEAELIPRHTPIVTRLEAMRQKFEPSMKGWCYVYFIQDGEAIKVGKTTNPQRRVEELQVASRSKLTLVCAVPAHHSFELAVHELFKPLATGREWFLLDGALRSFINRLKTGENPVAVLWDHARMAAQTEPLAFR